MIRLRVSDLDQWVRFIEPEHENFELSLDDFLAYMRRQSAPTDDMAAGSAFHALLENAEVGQEFDDIEGVESDGFRFFFDALDAELALPPLREESVERIYQTPSGPVLLRGKVDGFEPRTVLDYKLTFGQFDAERYADSLQWRAYLDMTSEPRFRHVVFEGKRIERGVWIRGVHDFEQWAYADMGAEVLRRVSELAAFVAVHVPELIVAEPQPA